MQFTPAPDISRRIKFLVRQLKLAHIKAGNVVCFRSLGSTSRARARIWSLPTIWQKALKVPAHYCLEVLSERFDHLTCDDQERVLIHELLHIPQTFSGALSPHRQRYHQRVEAFFQKLPTKSYARSSR